MKLWFQRNRSWLWVFLAAAVVGLSGCATEDPENQSARPWNSPKTWESGLPSSMFEGR